MYPSTFKYVLTIHKDDGTIQGVAGYAKSLKSFINDYEPLLDSKKVCQISLTREPLVRDNISSLTEAAIKRSIKND